MAYTKEDKSFKTLLNKRATSSDKEFYEEFGDRTLDVHADEVRAEIIAFDDPVQAILDGVVQEYTLLSLTLDNTVANQQAWFAFDTVRLNAWISDKYGASYAIKLFDGNDDEIFPTDPSEWLFDYSTGILTFNGNVSSIPKPFKITGYRYIGDYVSDVIGTGGGQLGTPRESDRDQTPATTSGDESDTTINIVDNPTGFIDVKVNGVSKRIGNGSKTKDCYFSSDGGTTAKIFANILAGDTLYWNGVIAGYDLASTDSVTILYI